VPRSYWDSASCKVEVSGEMETIGECCFVLIETPGFSGKSKDKEAMGEDNWLDELATEDHRNFKNAESEKR